MNKVGSVTHGSSLNTDKDILEYFMEERVQLNSVLNVKTVFVVNVLLDPVKYL